MDPSAFMGPWSVFQGLKITNPNNALLREILSKLLYICIYKWICIVPRNLQRSDPTEQTPKKTWVSKGARWQLTERGPLVKSHSIFDGMCWIPPKWAIEWSLSCHKRDWHVLYINPAVPVQNKNTLPDSKRLQILSKPRPCDNMIYHLYIYICILYIYIYTQYIHTYKHVSMASLK